uniref:Uncharacterized protein n=1 Tax=Triticum urartu TaxID=4572 RepID=A0A8R7JZ45_TRIUA
MSRTPAYPLARPHAPIPFLAQSKLTAAAAPLATAADANLPQVTVVSSYGAPLPTNPARPACHLPTLPFPGLEHKPPFPPPRSGSSGRS